MKVSKTIHYDYFRKIIYQVNRLICIKTKFLMKHLTHIQILHKNQLI